MGLLVSASILAAFIAGVAALFAPCCITVLLPAYFSSIFKQRRKVFFMTFIFFLGLLTVFLPLGLGFAGLGQLFSEYHNTLFLIGGFFLLILGSFILLGGHFSIPFNVAPKMKVDNAGSVYFLGIFSGFATLCCAPVLAGALALSVLPGSIVWGGVYTLAYALGMVAPLFLIAYFMDKTKVTEKISVLKKEMEYTLLGRKISLSISELVSGVTFFMMGILILYLSLTNQVAMQSSYQLSMNIFMANTTTTINQIFGSVPIYFWAAAVLIIFGLIIKIAIDSAKSE